MSLKTELIELGMGGEGLTDTCLSNFQTGLSSGQSSLSPPLQALISLYRKRRQEAQFESSEQSDTGPPSTNQFWVYTWEPDREFRGKRTNLARTSPDLTSSWGDFIVAGLANAGVRDPHIRLFAPTTESKDRASWPVYTHCDTDLRLSDSDYASVWCHRHTVSDAGPNQAGTAEWWCCLCDENM